MHVFVISLHAFAMHTLYTAHTLYTMSSMFTLHALYVDVYSVYSIHNTSSVYNVHNALNVYNLSHAYKAYSVRAVDIVYKVHTSCIHRVHIAHDISITLHCSKVQLGYKYVQVVNVGCRLQIAAWTGSRLLQIAAHRRKSDSIK